MPEYAAFTPRDRDPKVLAVAGRVEILRELDAREIEGNVRMFEVRSTTAGGDTHAFIDELDWEGRP